MNKLFLAFSLLLGLTSCSSKYKINGESSLTRLDGKKLFLMAYRDGEMTPIDSAEVVHGLFTMKGNLDSVEMVMLYMDDFNIMPFVLEKGKIMLQLDNTRLLAKGTPLNDRLYTFFNRKNTLDERLDDLERRQARLVMEGYGWDEIRRNLSQENERLNQEMMTLVKGFICDNYNNILGPGILRMLSAPYPSPGFDLFVEDIFKEAPDCFKNHYLVKECMVFSHEKGKERSN